MIGILVDWRGSAQDAALASRFAMALAAGTGKTGVSRVVGQAVLAGSLSPRVARGWHPVRTPTGDTLLFKGYLADRAEAAGTLGLDRHASDAEIYGSALARWDDQADLRLVGEYAAILWSAHGDRVRLVRSPLSAPPLHYWEGAGRFIAASTPRALFATGYLSAEIDEQKLADSMVLNYREEARSWFRDILRLPIGTRALVSADGVRLARYYDPLAVPQIRYRRDEDYVEAADALFQKAVANAMQGFSRPAVSLSGGYDSQAVAAYAGRALEGRGRVACFTSVPEPEWDGRVPKGRSGDERVPAQALAAMYPNLDLELVDAAGLPIDHRFEAILMASGCLPRNITAMHWIQAVHARAQAQGCDVMLTGQMGNTTLSYDGSGAIPGWFLSGRWGRAAREIWHARGEHRSLAHALGGRLIKPLMPPTLQRRLGKERPNARNAFEWWSPIAPAWAAEMQAQERAVAMGHAMDGLRARSTRDLRMRVLGNGINEGGDLHQALELLYGMPVRDPTWSRPLVEFLFGLPDDQYLRNGESRWLARRLLRGKLPDAALDARTRGLQAADWHLRIGRHRVDWLAEIDRLARDPAMAHRLNLPMLRRALQDWPAETPIEGRANIQLMQAVPRAIGAARFIRYHQGQNRE